MSASFDPNAVEVRVARSSDAKSLLELKHLLDCETKLMMYGPDERATTVGGVRDGIVALGQSENSALFVAAHGERAVGYAEATGGRFNRTRHSATVTAGVRQSYAGAGIGSRLFEQLVAWADSTRIARMELTVMKHNPTAIRLYEKFGLVSEGLRRCSMVVDGLCVDEYLMARVQEHFAEARENG